MDILPGSIHVLLHVLCTVIMRNVNLSHLTNQDTLFYHKVRNSMFCSCRTLPLSSLNHSIALTTTFLINSLQK